MDVLRLGVSWLGLHLHHLHWWGGRGGHTDWDKPHRHILRDLNNYHRQQLGLAPSLSVQDSLTIRLLCDGDLHMDNLRGSGVVVVVVLVFVVVVIRQLGGVGGLLRLGRVQGGSRGPVCVTEGEAGQQQEDLGGGKGVRGDSRQNCDLLVLRRTLLVLSDLYITITAQRTEAPVRLSAVAVACFV